MLVVIMTGGVYVWRDISNKDKLAFVKMLGIGTLCATVAAMILFVLVVLF